MDQEQIGKFISELRKEKNMTQEELANVMGVTDKSISRWENGKTMPDIAMLSTLSNNLGVSIQELLDGRKMTKEELLELKGSIEKLVLYESNQQVKKDIKTNKYIILGNVITFIAILNNAFGYFDLFLSENVVELLQGFLFGLGITLNLCGVYNNSHNISICEKKKAFIKKLRK